MQLEFKYQNNIEGWPKGCNYVIFLDENNSVGNFKTVQNKLKNHEKILEEERYFTLTGCIIDFSEYKKLRKSFNLLRVKYWDKGLWFCEKEQTNLKVVFHSRDIRKSKAAFSNFNRKDEFINELSKDINKINFKIISVSINLEEFVVKNDEEVYEVALKFILERLICFLSNKEKAAMVLESRGKKEDKMLINQLNKIISSNDIKIPMEEINNKIEGIYHLEKCTLDKRKVFPGLELADLCSYPIFKYVSYKKQDISFKMIESKIDKFPNYINSGLKIFPKKK